MTVRAISFRPDEATRHELEVLAELRGVTASDVIRQAIHEAYVAEQYGRARAELAEWRADPAYQDEIAAVQEEMSDLRAW
ncbi:ribbon-helix-helix protein, CopG family [Streptomyces sp. NPDC127033]|uniref:ribbon-helix-helix protein, CopG family n=1 Tax=Streptomyces sp. NPDC127033 TaxID=3347110 RepID=UPI00365DEF86